MAKDNYDYLVIGGGSAGAVVAVRAGHADQDQPHVCAVVLVAKIFQR